MYVYVHAYVCVHVTVIHAYVAYIHVYIYIYIYIYAHTCHYAVHTYAWIKTLPGRPSPGRQEAAEGHPGARRGPDVSL